MKRSKPIVLIRTDGNNKIGMGHIYRSIALSQELKKHGFEIHFFTSNNNMLIKKLSKYGKCHTANNNEAAEINKIKKIKPEIIIIDLLKKFFLFGSRYMNTVRKFCKLLVTIDYVAKELRYVDVSIHSLFGPKKFKAKKTFFDLKYAMIRKEFLKKAKFFKIQKNVNSILILQGGADTRCFSPKILKALNRIKKPLLITLITGSAFKCWKELKKQKRISKHKITLLHDVKNIQTVMVQNQIAISAGGNTMLELLSLGIPTIIICGDKHEVEAAKLVEKKKVAINLGFNLIINENILANNVLKLLNNVKLRKRFNARSKKVIDGKGITRISNSILQNYDLKN